VEKLLAEVHERPSAPDGAPALEEHCRLLDRVAGEAGRLHYYSARGEGLAFLAGLRPRVDAATSALTAELDDALRAALRLPPAAGAGALAICMHAYAAASRPQAAEQVRRGWGLRVWQASAQ
jgi:hypothetical protein